MRWRRIEFDSAYFNGAAMVPAEIFETAGSLRD